MTAAQNKKYWRRWQAVARANGWRMVQGRMDDAAVGRASPRAGSSVASPHHAAVWRAAEQLALQQHRSPTAEDLRHACHIVALGRDKSHDDFTNRDFDQVLAYWGDEHTLTGLLLEPLDLGSEIHRANPDLKSRERYLHFLQHDCLGGYVMSECERIFHTKEWEALPTDQLIELCDHLRARPKALKSSIGRVALPRNQDEPQLMPTTAGDPDWNV